ncbi:hypothetical protein ECZU18_30580 [Escherichia coli]|nr:hypothetical protein ECZU18_30580 [Escherichia coli]
MRRAADGVPAAYGVGRGDSGDGPDGRTVRYGYNSQRQVTSVTYPDGFAAAGSMMRGEG